MMIVKQVQQQVKRPFEAVCQELAVPYSSLMRWRSREQAGKALASKPGPAKVQPLDLAPLQADVRALDHGRERSRGTVALYERYRAQISRRDLHALVEATRRELRQEAQALERRIEWRVPGLVWSMDDTKKHWLHEGRFGHVHLVQDLGSRYKLRALADEVLASGWQVALNREDLFLRHGAPLFMKLDGGGNFRLQELGNLLGQYGVIPLRSPPYYPPYNGGVERGHQELRRDLDARIGHEALSARELRLQCELSAHEVNHKRRRSLGGWTACHALHIARPLVRAFGRRERKEVFEEISALTVDIAAELGQHTEAATETAFRYAAETWMQLNHVIRVTRNGEVLPTFYRFRSH